MNSMKKTILIISAFILGFALHYWIRFPALSLDFFHNEDSAGITYSADLVLRGGLPYIDTVEMKAPGPFFVLAQWWSWFGRSIASAQGLMFIWSFMASIGIGLGSWFLYRSVWSAIITSLLYIYLAPFTDSIDINYGAWMIGPYIYSAACLWWIYGERTAQSQDAIEQDKSSVNDSKLLSKAYIFKWILLGILIAYSALMKRQGAAVFPLALWVLYHWSIHRLKALVSLSFGLIVGFGSVFLFYWQQGHLLQGLKSYFFSKSGWDYLASNLIETGQNLNQNAAKLPRIWDGLVGIPVHLPVTSLLVVAVMTYVSIAYLDKSKSSTFIDEDIDDCAQPKNYNASEIDSNLIKVLLGFLILSFMGTALGLRFFKGYYLQMLPAMLWLGCYPQIWQRLFVTLKSLMLPQHRYQQPALKLLLLALIITTPFTVQSSWKHLSKARQMRSRPLYLPAMQIKELSQHIKRNTKATDQIWVWGRWGWPSYFYTERASATRYFKNLGVLTTQLTNTWNPQRQSSPTRFNPYSPWKEAIKELKAKPPKWIIIAKNESYQEFKALKRFLKKHYQSVSYQQLKVKTRVKRAMFKVYRLKSSAKH